LKTEVEYLEYEEYHAEIFGSTGCQKRDDLFFNVGDESKELTGRIQHENDILSESFATS
jgi:hypothetical protein